MVVPRTSPPKVVALEVERGLGEPVQVRDVVHGVDDVERVHARGVDVRLERVRVHTRILRVDEVERGGRLRRRDLLCAGKRHGVVVATCARVKGLVRRIRHDSDVRGSGRHVRSVGSSNGMRRERGCRWAKPKTQCMWRSRNRCRDAHVSGRRVSNRRAGRMPCSSCNPRRNLKRTVRVGCEHS